MKDIFMVNDLNRNLVIKDIIVELRRRAFQESERTFRFHDVASDILTQSVQDIGNHTSQLMKHLTPGTEVYQVGLDTIEVVQYRSTNTEEKARRVLGKLVQRFDSMLEALEREQ